MGQLLSLSLTCLMPSKAGGGVVHRTCLNLFHLVWGGGGGVHRASTMSMLLQHEQIIILKPQLYSKFGGFRFFQNDAVFLKYN